MAYPVCRVCLVGNIRMQKIDNINLLEIYEKLTNTKLNTTPESGMPSTICYVCYRLLQRCYRFSNMAHKSNKLFRDLLHYSNEETRPGLAIISLETMHNLMKTSVLCISVNDCSSTESTTPVDIKEEQVVLKEETYENEAADDSAMNLVTFYEKHIDYPSYTEPSQENCNQVKTSSNNPRFSCEVCHKKIASKYYLVKHLRIHTKTGEKPFSCSICKKTFGLKSTMNTHMKIHTGIKPYVCNICNKAFNVNMNLTIHMRTHTQERPYSCNFCVKTFTEQSHLITHERIHTGEKPFSCSECSKAFAQQSNLISHIRTHTGEKPYSCSHCHKSFSQRGSLNTHIQTHTHEKPYSCNRCAKTFARKSNLFSHMAVHSRKRRIKKELDDWP